jgi:hypothetical protein
MNNRNFCISLYFTNSVLEWVIILFCVLLESDHAMRHPTWFVLWSFTFASNWRKCSKVRKQLCFWKPATLSTAKMLRIYKNFELPSEIILMHFIKYSVFSFIFENSRARDNQRKLKSGRCGAFRNGDRRLNRQRKWLDGCKLLETSRRKEGGMWHDA